MSSKEPKSVSDNRVADISALGQAIFPKTRRKVLALFYLNTKKQYYFREIVRLLGDSSSTVQRELKSLTKVGILVMERIGIQNFYRANEDCPIFNELKNIVTKTFGLTDILREALEGRTDDISLSFVYGSIAAGNDSGNSDIDLMVIGSVPYRDLITLLRPVEDAVHRPVNPTLYSMHDFHEKLSAGNNFLQSVLKSDKLFIMGSEDDLAGLA